MNREFLTEHDATVFLRDYLRGEVEGKSNDGDRPTYQDEVPKALEEISNSIYEQLKDLARDPQELTTDQCLELKHLVSLRDAIWKVGEERWRQLVTAYLPSSPAQEYEALIRTVGPGYHPDTAYGEYEPPITEYSRKLWDAIHQRAIDYGIDLYEFGLPIIQSMLDARPKVRIYRDGSRSDQVVMEEVEDMLDRYPFNPEDVILEVLQWSEAARVEFSTAFEKKFGHSD